MRSKGAGVFMYPLWLIMIEDYSRGNDDFLALLASHTGRKVGSSGKRKPIGLPMQLPALDGELLCPKDKGEGTQVACQQHWLEVERTPISGIPSAT